MSGTDLEAECACVINIPRFHGRQGEDYGLWRSRLRAACRIKGVWGLVDKETSSEASSRTTTPNDVEKQKLNSEKEKASGIIISALGDSSLRVVADADGSPRRMLQLLDARYASNRTVSRIAVQNQLYRMRYREQDMAQYIDKYTSLFSQLEFMGKAIAIPEAHKAPMLLASVDPLSNMESIAAALRTKDASDLTWEYVTTTLIDEYNAKQKTDSKGNKHRGRKNRRKAMLSQPR